MIRVDHVSKSYGSNLILRSIDLEFAETKTYALIGASGCGKSTLLRMIVGLIEPDEGSIAIDKTVMSSKTAQALRRQIGYVIQQGGLFPHLTAQQNITLLAHHLKLPKAYIIERTGELAGLTRFPIDRLAAYPGELSGGQRQRIGLMRALMLDPELLLLDEPLAALDPITRVELQRDLKRIFDDLKKTVIMVTHDMDEADFFADEIVLLNAGRIAQQGTLKEFEMHPNSEFVTKFVNAQKLRA